MVQNSTGQRICSPKYSAEKLFFSSSSAFSTSTRSSLFYSPPPRRWPVWLKWNKRRWISKPDSCSNLSHLPPGTVDVCPRKQHLTWCLARPFVLYWDARTLVLAMWSCLSRRPTSAFLALRGFLFRTRKLRGFSLLKELEVWSALFVAECMKKTISPNFQKLEAGLLGLNTLHRPSTEIAPVAR